MDQTLSLYFRITTSVEKRTASVEVNSHKRTECENGVVEVVHPDY